MYKVLAQSLCSRERQTTLGNKYINKMMSDCDKYQEIDTAQSLGSGSLEAA